MNSKKTGKLILCGCAMFVLILDSKTALASARDSIELCLKTAIPALLPFLLLSSMLTSLLLGCSVPFLAPIRRICGILPGSESLVLTGLLGGYPTGALAVDKAYRDGALSRSEAHRLLGFCNNAGPSFLFGIAGPLFGNKILCWILWLIQVLSALTVASILPNRRHRRISVPRERTVSFASALSDAVKTMGVICGWILIMRVLTGFLERWFLWLLPDNLQVITVGFLELINGCSKLFQIPQEGARFVLCSCMLSFGGICVMLQTRSATESVGTGMYFPGKVLHCLLATALAYFFQLFWFEPMQQMHGGVTIGIILSVLIVFLIPYTPKMKKTVAFSKKIV